LKEQCEYQLSVVNIKDTKNKRTFIDQIEKNEKNEKKRKQERNEKRKRFKRNENENENDNENDNDNDNGIFEFDNNNSSVRLFNVKRNHKLFEDMFTKFDLKLQFKVPEKITKKTLLYFLDNPTSDNDWRSKRYFEDINGEVFFPESYSVLYHNHDLYFRGQDNNLKFYLGNKYKTNNQEEK